MLSGAAFTMIEEINPLFATLESLSGRMQELRGYL
jgi:hypothetical protein